jgi:glycosyltransferase involved in cell wall biosynthesis
MAENNVNIIFVGRITPNKRQDDTIKAFYYYHKYINPNSKLYIIGREHVVRYVQELKAMVGMLGLQDSIIFTGSVSDKDIASYYKAANLFLSMSEHEGFCVPLLEAMNFDVPIMAYKSTGVPYTMADAGILFNKKDYIQIAEMIDALISNRDFKEKVVKKQRSRLQDFNKKMVESKLIEVIRGIERC